MAAVAGRRLSEWLGRIRSTDMWPCIARLAEKDVRGLQQWRLAASAGPQEHSVSRSESRDEDSVPSGLRWD